MKLISERYRKLQPRIEYLADEVVIAQAWKKTHGYMRAHNWYADTLALDVSALGLERNAALWADTLRKGRFVTRDLELVPAAKSECWLLDQNSGWVPQKAGTNERNTTPPLRPLAHLMVREQTWATAVMMCLADAVETAQGDCSIIDFNQLHKQRVYSYGNRLICDWRDTDAWFRWGNAETYRKFFTDYQNFLSRPIQVGRSVANTISDIDHVYVINLDLSKFYDNIDRKVLLSRLSDIHSGYSDQEPCREFWSTASKILRWKWNDEARADSERLRLTLGDGLPQGLVASGFFANAYMVNFDRRMGNFIGEALPAMRGVLLHDYCRYVDDIRLVVSMENFDSDGLIAGVNRWISTLLKTYAGKSIELNEKKTKITSLSDLDNRGSLSGRITLLQDELSGPADRDVLENASAVLEGLLTTSPDEVPESSDTLSASDKAIFRLARFDHDIRLDTLKRFAANRLESITRNKRKLTPIDSQDSRAESLADNESELLAKKLVRAWMQDPSLGLVLRKAIEIFPSPLILEPVLEAIYSRSAVGGAISDVPTAAMMNYLLADIFRCCVDFNGFFQRIDYPKSAAPEEALDVAASYAQKVLSVENPPKFLERQALLLLAVLQKPVVIGDKDVAKTIQHSLNAILAGRVLPYQHQRLALFEVASQITGKPNLYASYLLQTLERQDEDAQYDALEDVAKRGGEFWTSVWKRLSRTQGDALLERLKWAAPVFATDLKSSRQKLSKIIASDSNGFTHELALIKLALALINLAEKNPELLPLSPCDIDVSKGRAQALWTELWEPEVTRLKCETAVEQSSKDPRFAIPPWVDRENLDHVVAYWLGAVLRAAVVGGNDYTGNRWKSSKVVSYKGLRTGWYKRRMGMMHSAEALVGSYATVSNWLSELLMKCLQWPGFESTYVQSDDIAEIDDIQSLRKALKARQELLEANHCSASRMPTLVTSIKRPSLATRSTFRIVTVQQLIPRTNDFTIGDPTLDLPKARAENRGHLARVCQLTYKTLAAKLEADRDLSRASADLIVFPEAAVHVDDQDLIKRLADKTKSIVLAGLVFLDHEGKLVNLARWFIPDYRESGRQWIIRDQGKANMTKGEEFLGVTGHRPCQHIIELTGSDEGSIRISGAICYDATDLNLAADLKKKTDLFVVCAHNKDVSTFDTMASALNYHMYQHVVVVNKGEFGGSTVQAPYKEHYDRLVSHVHGADQISIHIADIDPAAFRRKHKTYKAVKTKPAG